MNSRTLLASVALFSELYNQQKDIYDVIGELIKASMVLEGIWALDATKATEILADSFDLDIPQAVVKTTLSKRLTRDQGALRYEGGSFYLKDEQLRQNTTLVSAFQALKKKQTSVIGSLETYIEEQIGAISREEKDEAVAAFFEFLSGNTRQSKYLAYISAFVMRNKGDPKFVSGLNEIREGLVLYDGVRHTPNLDSAGVWNEPLLVFLDPEHLFNALGYNGVLYEQLFSDFHRLSKQARVRGRKQISLWYTNSCRDEIDSFFHVAELIVQGKASPLPGKPAMEEILNGCSKKSDVLAKKSRFIAALKRLGVRNDSSFTDSINPEFNIESQGLLQQLEEDIKGAGIAFDQQKCISTLRTFSAINAVRRGDSKTSFERSKAVLLTGSLQTRFLSLHPEVRYPSNGIPFATDLDYITNRLWFRLGIGLSKRLSPPSSLDVLAKAQVVLASQVNEQISKKYEEVKADYGSGRLDKDSAEYLLNDLRSRSLRPEGVREESVSELAQILSESSYEDHLREKRQLERRAKDGDAAMKQLRRIRKDEYDRYLKRHKRVLKVGFYISFIGICVLILSSYALGALFIFSLAGPEDTQLSIVVALLTIVIPTIPVIKIKSIYGFLRHRHFLLIREQVNKAKRKVIL